MGTLATGELFANAALSERLFNCEACELVIDRDLNGALNLARMACQHAQAEGLTKCYVARTGRETQNARGGQLSPGTPAGLGPLKREASPEATQAREGLALAA